MTITINGEEIKDVTYFGLYDINTLRIVTSTERKDYKIESLNLTCIAEERKYNKDI